MRNRRAEAANIAPDKLGEWAGGLVDDVDGEIVELRDEMRQGFTDLRLDNAAIRSRVTSVLVAIIVATITISGSLIAVLINGGKP